MKRIAYPLLFWLFLVVLAIVNGTVRVVFFLQPFGDLVAHQLSCVTGIALFLAAMYFFFQKTKLAYSSRELLVMGVCWTAMTILFEFGFGHYIMGNSWAKLLADYNLFAGRLWVLVLLAVLAGPSITYPLARK